MEENRLPKKSSRWRLGTILWPLFLIAFGILLLLDNLGVLQQDAWNILWNLWPLFFIALGLEALLRRKEIFGPVFWFGLGGVFLLSNFGVLGWDAWRTLIRLWPLLLVTGGLEVILGKRSIWLSTLVSAAVLGGLVFALGLTGVKVPVQGTTETSVNQPLGTAEHAEVTIGMAAGDLRLYSLLDSNALISGEISVGDDAGVRTQASTHGDTAVYSLEHTNPIVVPFEHAWKWDLGLTPKASMELETNMGAGAMELSLSGLTLEELDVGQGVGDIQVNLPMGDYRVEVDQAIGQIKLAIPEDVPVRLEISRAVSNLSLPPDFEKQAGYFYSPGARSADEFIQIVINQAIGNIMVYYAK